MAINYKNNLNKLIYGDNLTVMKEMPEDYVDLIYLDPPFNSNKNYNMMYKTMTGRPVPEQIEAFCDTWTFSSEDVEKLRMIRHTLESYDLDSSIIDFWDNWLKALRTTNDKLLSYLFYMMERLFQMRRILKPTGSIYLHCDPTASHYIKVMMDGVFGHNNFRNEIVWWYDTGGMSKKDFSRKHDIILRYSKDKNYFSDIESCKTLKNENQIKRYKLAQQFGENNSYRLNSEYKLPHDVWKIHAINPKAKERLGYPTQKPIALLERIIKSSCPENGIIFDPFCGCGTTIYATQKLNYEHKLERKWIGCDVAVLSTRLVKETLELGKQPLMNAPLKLNEDFELCGYPVSVEGAKLLFQQDPKQFEHWAVEWVGGFINKKQSGDKGIDGRIYFEMKERELGKMVISVKGGKNINPAMVRELRGTMERENSQFAGLILTEEPTKGMLEEANQGGQIEFFDYKYNKIQILTIKDMTVDKKIFFLPNRIGHKHRDAQLELYL